MSMLSSQVNNLRLMARLWARSWPEVFESAREHSMELESVRESRWFELLGTPERAARTLSVTANCFRHETACRNCMYESYCDTQCDYDALLEWLKGGGE